MEKFSRKLRDFLQVPTRREIYLPDSSSANRSEIFISETALLPSSTLALPEDLFDDNLRGLRTLASSKSDF